MKRRVRLLSALAAGTLAFVVGTSTAHAVINTTQYPCQVAIGKEGAKFVKGELKLWQKCINATPPDCSSPPDLDKLRNNLRAGLLKKCTFIHPSQGVCSVHNSVNCTNDSACTAPACPSCVPPETCNKDVTPGNLRAIGFPGPCLDTDPPSETFSMLDLQNCIESSHETIIAGMLAVEYDAAMPTPTGTALTCQKEIAKNSATFVAALMKNVQKCRNDLVNCKTDPGPPIITTCKLAGVLPRDCATDLGPALASKCTGGSNADAACEVFSDCPGGTCDGIKFANQKTIDAIAKARDKAINAIASKCSDDDVVAIKACEPDPIPGAGAATAAATCESVSHQAFTDNPDATAASDLIDYEYAQRGFCGDNRNNQPNEECDGDDDSACPGKCGAAISLFPCLCKDSFHKRTRVVEHANSDLDNGWTGQSHDSGIVEGGGYVTDLWDCDGPAGPDTICNVGPSCFLPPNQPCSPSPTATGTAANADSMCPGAGNFCRQTGGGATGPHCEIDLKKRCKDNTACLTLGDRCTFVPHGAPLPISSGGVSVCIVNIFSEDVVGTTNLSTTLGPGPGEGAVRLRQVSSTYLGQDQEQPCPVCGGFCSGPAGQTTPGVRNLCENNDDCHGGASCITAPVCSYGLNKDRPCNPNTPSGGGTEFFGNPSVDCPVGQGALLLGSLDILFNPATTGSAAPLTTNTDCGTTGWTNKVCAGGDNQHRPCTADSECSPGTCNEQCFCGGGAQKPNACLAACLHGAFDGQSCSDDSECDPPTGFCHPGDCRLNSSDTDSTQEGICTVGPSDGRCSVHTFKTCDSDAGCGGGLCPFCDTGEICKQVPRQCFVNPTMTRAGKPAVPFPVENDHDRTTAATFCIAITKSAAVNATAGLPGPGAITTVETISEVGF